MDPMLLMPFKKRGKSDYSHNHTHNVICFFRYKERSVAAIVEYYEYPDEKS